MCVKCFMYNYTIQCVNVCNLVNSSKQAKRGLCFIRVYKYFFHKTHLTFLIFRPGEVGSPSATNVVLLLVLVGNPKTISLHNRSSPNFTYTHRWQYCPQSHRDGFPAADDTWRTQITYGRLRVTTATRCCSCFTSMMCYMQPEVCTLP